MFFSTSLSSGIPILRLSQSPPSLSSLSLDFRLFRSVTFHPYRGPFHTPPTASTTPASTTRLRTPIISNIRFRTSTCRI